MTELLDALRKKFESPRDVCRALGLDEAILRDDDDRKPKLTDIFAKDASLADVMEFIDAVKGGGAANQPAVAQADEYEDDDEEPDEDEAEDEDDMIDPNAAIPMGGEKDKFPPEPAAEKVGTDNEGGPEKMAKIQELLKMLQELIGGDVPAPAIDEDPAIDPLKVSEPAKRDEPAGVKGAMDAAITAAVKRANATAREIREAERFVRPWVGELAIACDSAEQVHRQAAKALGIDGADTIHASALQTLIKMQPKPGVGPGTTRAHVAMDASATGDFNKRFPDAARIRFGAI